MWTLIARSCVKRSADTYNYRRSIGFGSPLSADLWRWYRFYCDRRDELAGELQML